MACSSWNSSLAAYGISTCETLSGTMQAQPCFRKDYGFAKRTGSLVAARPTLERLFLQIGDGE